MVQIKIISFLFALQNSQYPPAPGGFRVTNGHESIELVENRSQSPSPPGMMIPHSQDQLNRSQCRENRSSSVILRRLSVNVTGAFRSQKKTFLKKQVWQAFYTIFYAFKNNRISEGTLSLGEKSLNLAKIRA